MATEGAALVRVGNPLSAPLSLRRLLIQIDPGEFANDNEGHGETRLAELLESRAASGPVVLVIDRAETLEADALLALQHVASGSGAVKVVFFGSPTFWQLLDDQELAPLRHALNRPAAAAVDSRPATPPPAATNPPGITPERWRPPASQPVQGWWLAAVLGLLITGVSIALLAPDGLFHPVAPQPKVADMATSATSPAVAPQTGSAPESEPPSAAPAPGPAPSSNPQLPSAPAQSPVGIQPPGTFARPPPARPSAQPSAPSSGRADARQVRPRTRFERFVAGSGYEIDSLSDEERALLLGRFLAGEPAGTPKSNEATASEAADASRVVIHYNENATTGETINRLAEQAAPFAASVQARAVAHTPFMAEIRYFHPSDLARARELATALRAVRPNWQIRDFSQYRPGPLLGTIEVWIPSR